MAKDVSEMRAYIKQIDKNVIESQNLQKLLSSSHIQDVKNLI